MEASKPAPAAKPSKATPQPQQGPSQPDTHDEDTTGSTSDLSDEEQAQAQGIRIDSYERELREAHAHPETDEEGAVTNVQEVMGRYNEAREDKFREQQDKA